ncbi:MAG: LL-diaminopimelate aminotransferase [Desulfobacteraceae bacterium]|jgi:LL-diaminopimelate aminotransferase|nr:LL-diaminopimelate aminotransferase [Desulfobacteraceae bacterium]
MIRINEDYLKLKASYLFSDIAGRIKAFEQAHPDRTIIRLGIGDVTRALPPVCVAAFHQAVDEMSQDATFRGYGPEQGYEFLRQAIAAEDFQARGADIQADEIFISDGSKCDTGNFQELFAKEARIAIPDPVYPVYLDTNVMAGRSGASVDGRYEGIVYLEGSRENGFVAGPPDVPADLVYLCFPNNPTGAAIDRSRLAAWVDWAKDRKALILFDAAYEAFIRDDSLPRSIFEIPGAREVAVEFRSFSKTAGFTGTRCACTVVPKDCKAYTAAGEMVPVHRLWSRRQSTKFNGVAYPVQRAAAAVYTPEGRQQAKRLVDGYLANADVTRDAMQALGFTCFGGRHSPYIWVDCRRPSWEFFDLLLERAGVVCTPGAGFGRCGEGYARISAFNSPENARAAMTRIREALAEG